MKSICTGHRVMASVQRLSSSITFVSRVATYYKLAAARTTLAYGIQTRQKHYLAASSKARTSTTAILRTDEFILRAGI